MEGTIIKLVGGQYTVLDAKTGAEIICQARGKLRQMKLEKGNSFLKSNTARTKVEAKSIKLRPKVGDHVSYEIFDGTGYIMEVFDRKNELNRPDIANVDQALLLFAAKEPEFSFILLDRFLALIEREGITPIIIVSKIDLLDQNEMDELKEKLCYYEKYYRVYYTSSKEKIGIKELKEIFSKKISVLTGQTGVGKSSLINCLIPDFALETQEISQALGRGKHTTRCTSLYQYMDGMIADTPGFGSLDYGNMTVNDLASCFVDFDSLKGGCKFKGCLHIKEPGCCVIDLYQKKEILTSRYENYLRFVDEIKCRKVRY